MNVEPVTQPIVSEVLVGQPQPLGSANRLSAIRKSPVAGPARVDELGFEGDAQHDRRHHGGPMKAVCLYPAEHYTQWIVMVGHEMPVGSFGENLSTLGILEADACIGDVFAVGSALLQVTGPRVPCGNLTTLWEHPGFHPVVTESHKTGFYLRTVRAGMITVGDSITLVSREYPQWSIKAMWEKVWGEDATAEELQELLSLESLDDDWKRRAEKLLNKLKPGVG